MITPLEITKAEHLEGYRLLVWFNDGALKIIDLTGYLHKLHLAPLKEAGHIRRFQIDLGTIIWEGEIDIAPEYLYNIATDTLRPGDRSRWEWGEPYSEKALQPQVENLSLV
jgi:Protein of unknown function (DUF2442)